MCFRAGRRSRDSRIPAKADDLLFSTTGLAVSAHKRTHAAPGIVKQTHLRRALKEVAPPAGSAAPQCSALEEVEAHTARGGGDNSVLEC